MLENQLTEPSRLSGRPNCGRRIVIDALAARFGGTAYATVQLARHLAARPEVAAVAVIARSGSIVERGLAHEQSITCVRLPAAGRFELVRRTAWQALRLPAVVAREGCDAVISMSGMLPRSAGCPVIALVFNPVMYERAGVGNRVRRWAVRRTAQQAHHVAAPSRYMADLVSTSTGRDCAVVPLGVDHDLFAPAANSGREILCVADFYAHKRHDLLLDAWLRLPSPRPLLHFVGNPAVDPVAHARLVTRIAALPEANSILLEHDLDLQRLLDAYHRARVFVMPSERESFCMPLVESMACGVPAIARALPSTRETAGAGAQYVDSDDPARWTVAVRRLIESDGEHEQARRAAIHAAAR
jgi:glycosyltransferase involved in cell wall biosynthesis